MVTMMGIDLSHPSSIFFTAIIATIFVYMLPLIATERKVYDSFFLIIFDSFGVER
jgi:hypothetical protein